MLIGVVRIVPRYTEKVIPKKPVSTLRVESDSQPYLSAKKICVCARLYFEEVVFAN